MSIAQERVGAAFAQLRVRLLQGLFQDEAHSGIHPTQIEHLPTRRFSAEQSTNMGAEHKVYVF